MDFLNRLNLFTVPLSDRIVQPSGSEAASMASVAVAVPASLASKLEAAVTKEVNANTSGLQTAQMGIADRLDTLGPYSFEQVAKSVVSLALTRDHNKTFSSRLVRIRIMIALMKNESGFKAEAVSKVSHLYKGRRVTSVAKGLMQFVQGSYAIAYDRGYKMFSESVVLRAAIKTAKTTDPNAKLRPTGRGTWTAKTFPNDQFIACLGQMSLLNGAIGRDWFYTVKGWQSKGPLASNSAGKYLNDNFPAVLRSLDDGYALLHSFYHINGLNALRRSSVSHADRLKADVATFRSLSAGGILKAVTPILTSEARSLVDQLLSSLGSGEFGDPNPLEDAKIQNASVLSKFAVPGLPIVPSGSATIASAYGGHRHLRIKGVTTSRIHEGIDLVADFTSVFAPAELEILRVSNDPEGWGRFIHAVVNSPVILSGIDGSQSAQPIHVVFGHLSKVFVKPGDKVRPFRVIGQSGASGRASGPHLHVETSTGPPKKGTDNSVDPSHVFGDKLRFIVNS